MNTTIKKFYEFEGLPDMVSKGGANNTVPLLTEETIRNIENYVDGILNQPAAVAIKEANLYDVTRRLMIVCIKKGIESGIFASKQVKTETTQPIEQKVDHGEWVTEKKWEEFRATGLPVLINSLLHAFGWAVVFGIDQEAGVDVVTKVFPARVKYRVYDEKTHTEAYRKISAFLHQEAADLLNESMLEE